MADSIRDDINFDKLESELHSALDADEKYWRENDAKFREHKVTTLLMQIVTSKKNPYSKLNLMVVCLFLKMCSFFLFEVKNRAIMVTCRFVSYFVFPYKKIVVFGTVLQ